MIIRTRGVSARLAATAGRGLSVLRAGLSLRLFAMVSAPALAVLLAALASREPGPEVGLMAFGAFCLGLLVIPPVSRWAEQRKSDREELHALRRARRRTALRRFWRVALDFQPAGWGRGELQALRFVCLNTDVSRPLGERMARRLREALSAVLAGSYCRLEELVSAAEEAGLDSGICRPMGVELAALVSRLERSSCEPGRPPVLEAGAIVAHIDALLEATDRLTERVRPRIEADLLPMLRWLSRARFPRGSVEVAALAASGASTRVAVRPLDLAAALEGFIDRILRRGQIDGVLRVEVRCGEELDFQARWSVRDRWHLEPGVLLEPLAELSAYGGEFAMREEVEAGRAIVELRLPLVTPRGAADLETLDDVI
ncbi:MAG: hypothetical protein Q9Q40_00600 [Acidobacteriota bacterium]|nr:hypothetical protein [Acidobacteriota bacterium]